MLTSPVRRVLFPILLCSVAVAPGAGAQAIVRGEVYDSLISGAPMAGATIQVHGTTRSATTDRRGRFVLRDLPAGRYTFGFFHPLLDSLGLAAPFVTAEVGDRGTIRVSLATPSANGLSLRLCGRPAEASTAVVFGTVRAAEDSARLVDAEASVRWFEYEPLASAPREVERLASSRTDSAGGYVLCGVPTDISVSLLVAYREQATGALHLALDAAGIARRDVTVSLTDTAARRLPAARSDDTVPVARPPGAARVRVTVRGTQGRPLKGAVVGIRGTTSFATTNLAGLALLNGVPAGSQTLVVRAIGLTPAIRVVSLVPGADLVLGVTLERFATLLPTVVVTGLGSTQLDLDFARRKRAGDGSFFEGEAMRNVAMGLGLWGGIPGMRVAGARGSDAMPLMRGTMGSCVPDVWLDGARMHYIEGWELRLMLMDARRMEVYTSYTRVPPEFMNFASFGSFPCGAILLWSR